MILREGTERAAGSPAGPRALRGRRSKKIAPIADRGSKVTAVGHRSFPLFACDGTSTPPTRLHGTGKMISIAPMIMPPPPRTSQLPIQLISGRFLVVGIFYWVLDYLPGVL